MDDRDNDLQHPVLRSRPRYFDLFWVQRLVFLNELSLNHRAVGVIVLTQPDQGLPRLRVLGLALFCRWVTARIFGIFRTGDGTPVRWPTLR